jgi:hypothetical protein
MPAPAVHVFASAVASLSMPRHGAFGRRLIHGDTTLSLARLPEGERLGMTADYGLEDTGVGLIEVAYHDVEGRFGRCVPARLASRPTY